KNSGGVLHGVVYNSRQVFHQFLNLDAGMGGFKPLNGFQGPAQFTVTPEMDQAEVAWVVTEKPAVSIRKVLSQTSAMLVSKQRVMVGRRGN
ncbi:MAG TPA: hypothetical protein VK465_00430, partial [Fibrobacteria bacterium]|nr:hypothetical protein [Fibrobacteria bacterium]